MYHNIGGFVTAQIFTSEMSIPQYVSIGSAINLISQIREKIFYSQKWNFLPESVKNNRGLCSVTTFFESLTNKARLLQPLLKSSLRCLPICEKLSCIIKSKSKQLLQSSTFCYISRAHKIEETSAKIKRTKKS